jgi:hypothetical protein
MRKFLQFVRKNNVLSIPSTGVNEKIRAAHVEFAATVLEYIEDICLFVCVSKMKFYFIEWALKTVFSRVA